MAERSLEDPKVSDYESPKYGRGKFEAHPSYVKYMEMIVGHPNYKGMPNARSLDGRINWQVSSGKTTSFYKDYLARRDWWIAKANSLRVPGKDDENDRFTVTARMIHPTGYRACRLCGALFNVGYFYVSQPFAKRLTKRFPALRVSKGMAISEVIAQLAALKGSSESKGYEQYFQDTFLERRKYFEKHGVTGQAFEQSRHIRAHFLSPGFMGNPPDRLDGFHDYHMECRKSNDPGRFDDNMRSYIHDRRSFIWWAEGNWFVVDALYNSAGPGECAYAGCGKKLDKISPDHVGPLACGFRQIPFFRPLCQNHNSAKNRRFTIQDVRDLLEYENRNGETVASWQTTAHWNKYKGRVTNDNQTKALSNSLRSLQDMYLRVLWELRKRGKSRFLATLLRPEYAYQEVEFADLDRSKLTFTGLRITQTITPYRQSMAARTVRIAFESLEEYASKPLDRRKMVRRDFDDNLVLIQEALAHFPTSLSSDDEKWESALSTKLHAVEREQKISQLLMIDRTAGTPADNEGKQILQALFDRIGNDAAIDFTRYGELEFVL